jgi:hypothetical protein
MGEARLEVSLKELRDTEGCMDDLVKRTLSL